MEARQRAAVRGRWTRRRAPRAKFLDEVCASDHELRAELESLLAVGDGLTAEFLESPSPDKSGADGRGFDAAGLAAGQLFAQRFQLVRRLGEGGMGQVWLAEQIAPVRRSVALKLIKAGMYDETVVQRFQAERQSLAIMDHPAIAKVFDAGITPQGQPYFVMEYVPGLTITEYCDQKKLNIRERLELFIHACDGVQHAHQKAIIHRDLKPANILVIEVDDKPVPRIIDFGLAKAATAETAEQTLFTRFGQFMGTPGYMSPEQVDPNIRDIDTRTDVYSLGVILYVLLTGLQPFETKRHQRPALDEWLRQLREQEPPVPSTKLGADRESAIETAASRNTEPQQLVSQLRGDLDWITIKALDRDRERRYGTPADLAADLRRHLNDEPVLARVRRARAIRFGKFVRRHRVAAAVARAMTVLAIVASGTGLIAFAQTQREAQFQAAQALQAQSRLLTQAAAQRLKDSDVAGAQGIILQVLTNPAFAPLPYNGSHQCLSGDPRGCRLAARRALGPFGSRRNRSIFAGRHAYRHRINRQDRAHLGCAYGGAARDALGSHCPRRGCRLFSRRRALCHGLGRPARAHLGCAHRRAACGVLGVRRSPHLGGLFAGWHTPGDRVAG